MMNPDWDGVMKARARETKPKADSPPYVPMDLNRAVKLLDQLLATNHNSETWLAWCAVRQAILRGDWGTIP